MYCFTCPLHIFIHPKFSYVKEVCCPGILNMYPCNLNNPVDFTTHFVTPQILSCGQCEAAWNMRWCTFKCCAFQDLCAICTQKCCIFLDLCDLYSLQGPQKWGCHRTHNNDRQAQQDRATEGSETQARAIAWPLRNPYVGKFQTTISM